VTLLLESIVRKQEPLPVHAPLQPAKSDVPFGVAVSVTCVPESYEGVQAEPQFTPSGDETTVAATAAGALHREHEAVHHERPPFTARAAVIVTVQSVVPVHAPVQPVNVERLSGAADNVTGEPDAKLAEHVEPHDTASGDDVTTPPPVPAFGDRQRERSSW